MNKYLIAVHDKILQYTHNICDADVLVYDDLNNEMLTRVQSYFYEQGFLDCLKLLKFLSS